MTAFEKLLAAGIYWWIARKDRAGVSAAGERLVRFAIMAEEAIRARTASLNAADAIAAQAEAANTAGV